MCSVLYVCNGYFFAVAFDATDFFRLDIEILMLNLFLFSIISALRPQCKIRIFPQIGYVKVNPIEGNKNGFVFTLYSLMYIVEVYWRNEESRKFSDKDVDEISEHISIGYTK